MAVLMLALALTGCNGGGNAGDDGGFSVLIPAESPDKPDGLYQKSLERLQSLTDVPITWEYMSDVDGASVLKMQIASGEFPEVYIGGIFQPSDISQFAANEIIIPIEDYINEKDTPNIYKLYQERPAIKAASVAPDGHIYTLPGLKEDMASYLENIMYINKVWLDKLGLDIPKTLDDLKVVLKAFKEQDPNGNGQADEIPLTFNLASSSDYPEVLLSSWGLSTKYGTWDSWLTVQDGEVKFAPVLDEWKEMIAYYRDLYAEGLLDMEAFTQTGEQYNAKKGASVSKIGVHWSNANAMANSDEYIAIEPLSADGKIKPAWRIHPGYIGTKDFMVIFKNCRNPKEALKWADKFYEIDNSIQNAFGEAAENSTLSKVGDNFVWNELPEGEVVSSYMYSCVLTSGMPCFLPEEVYGSEKFPFLPGQEEKKAVYEMYKPYLDDEVWPRPYYAVEEANRLSELTTDIFSLVETKRAKWITGAEDLESGWEQYKADIKRMGGDEMLSIYQGAYDRYQAGMPK
ncbi:MAG: extracellular solute-binding protein [Clostridia bacterium]|nr:extracellular solute-binding protein [Clostridia bacterium]